MIQPLATTGICTSSTRLWWFDFGIKQFFTSFPAASKNATQFSGQNRPENKHPACNQSKSLSHSVELPVYFDLNMINES